MKPKFGGPGKNICSKCGNPIPSFCSFGPTRDNVTTFNLRRPPPTAPEARDVPGGQQICAVLRLLKRNHSVEREGKDTAVLRPTAVVKVACGGNAKPLSRAAASNRAVSHPLLFVLTARQVRVVHCRRYVRNPTYVLENAPRQAKARLRTVRYTYVKFAVDHEMHRSQLQPASIITARDEARGWSARPPQPPTRSLPSDLERHKRAGAVVHAY